MFSPFQSIYNINTNNADLIRFHNVNLFQNKYHYPIVVRSTYFSFVILSPSEIISELVLKYKVLHHPVKEEGSRGFNMINGNVILGKFSTMG
jgi:hypothetical protein